VIDRPIEPLPPPTAADPMFDQVLYALRAGSKLWSDLRLSTHNTGALSEAVAQMIRGGYAWVDACAGPIGQDVVGLTQQGRDVVVRHGWLDPSADPARGTLNNPNVQPTPEGKQP
jgi:hypothetical protein